MNVLKSSDSVNAIVKNSEAYTEQSADYLTEINQHMELVRIIKRHEFCHGWTLLIAPDHLPKKQVLIEAGVNLDKVLIIHKKNCHDVLFKAYQALKQDNFSALVIWHNLLTESETALLSIKAEHTTTSLYLLNQSVHDQQQVTH